jgi:CHASE3 domain sensor protein
MQPQSSNHSHPELEQRLDESRDILLEVRDIARGLRGHLVTIDERLTHIEAALRRITPNGHAQP